MLQVSDHALVRFLQRVAGVDVEALRVEIARSLDRAAVAAERIGGGDYTIRAEGVTYRIKKGVVTTVYPGGSQWGD